MSTDPKQTKKASGLPVLRLSHKALIVVAFPLICEFIFVAVLISTLQALEKQYAKEAKAKDILVLVNLEMQNMIEGMSAYGMYELNKDQKYLDEFHASLDKLKNDQLQLKRMLEMNPEVNSAELRMFDDCGRQVADTFEESRQLIIVGNRIDTMRGVLRLQKMLKKVRQSGAQVIERQAETNREQREEQERLRRTVQYVIIGGFGLNAGIAFALVLYFNLGTARRLSALSDNANAFAMDKPLKPPLSGEDEIAAIDSAFHTMANLAAEVRYKEKALTENATEVICSLDKRNYFTKLNPAVNRNWHYSEDDLMGGSVLRLFDDENWKRFQNAVEQAVAASTAHGDEIDSTNIELVVKRKDSELIDTEWSMNWSPKDSSLFCVVHDITERKQVEKLKRELNAMINHDLRTPLTALHATVFLFQEGRLGELNEKGVRKIEQSEVLLDRMLELTNNLLEMEKLDSKSMKLTCSWGPAQAVLERAISMVENQAEKKNISLKFECEDFQVYCDVPNIERVIANLMFNAVKFSPANSTITCSVRKLNGSAGFAVADQGRGISPAEQQKLFARFSQLRSSDKTELKGSGLGLSICKAIVQAHKGEIGVNSEEGKGSTFWFTLPFPASEGL